MTLGRWIRVFLGVVGGLLAPVAIAAAEQLTVVTSLKPIHSLVAGVMDGVGEPTLLIKGGASPHTAALRPSDAAQLQRADVVFWIGPAMETFLDKPLRALPHGARIIALHEAEGVRLLPYRTDDDDHEEHHDAGREPVHGHEAGHENEHEDEHRHGHGGLNMHMWLDPANADAMVATIARTLSAADPAHGPRYDSNATALRQRLADLDTALLQDLAPIRDRPYIVLHDAYQYLEDRYDLTPAGAIAVNPERPPSAQRLAHIRDQIIHAGAVCVFSEPQFDAAVVHAVMAGTNARTGVLDAIGADLPPGPDAYFTMMRGLASSLAGCLAIGN